MQIHGKLPKTHKYTKNCKLVYFLASMIYNNLASLINVENTTILYDNRDKFRDLKCKIDNGSLNFKEFEINKSTCRFQLGKNIYLYSSSHKK